MNLHALIPAAGRSVRLGQPKQLIDYQEGTLIFRLVKMLLELPCRSVTVVLPPADFPATDRMEQEVRAAGGQVCFLRQTRRAGRQFGPRDAHDFGPRKPFRNADYSLRFTADQPGGTGGNAAQLFRFRSPGRSGNFPGNFRSAGGFPAAAFCRICRAFRRKRRQIRPQKI